MASKYLQKYPVPSGFQQILADFTRQVLRDQPPNIIEYAAKYFEMLEKGEKFEFNSKFNVSKEDKKYQLSYNPKNAQEITKKASNITARVNDAGKPNPKQSSAPAYQNKAQKSDSRHIHDLAREEEQVLPPVNPVGTQKTVNQQEVQNYMTGQEFRIVTQQIVNQIFDQIDIDNNGYITSSEIEKAIGQIFQGLKAGVQFDQSQIQEFIQVVDTNRDGKLSREELFEFVIGLFGGDEAEGGEQGQEQEN